jgi:16S rRNA G527 N7-methylase RsmG
VGLPGLALAVVWPQTELTLIDRSQKRLDLARRGARVCGIEVATRLADLEGLGGPVAAIVSRAARPASQLAPLLKRLLLPGGRAVVSGSRGPAPPGFIDLVVPPWEGSLDPAPRLLMMTGA